MGDDERLTSESPEKNLIRRCLEKSPMFGGLSDEDLEILAEAVVPMKVQAGDRIFSEGQDAAGCYVVVSGRVKVSKISPEGKEHVLHTFGFGEPIGEVALFSGRKYPAGAEAMTDALLIYFSREEFIRLVERRPQLALNMLAALSERLRRFAQMVEDLALKEVSARLAKYLLDLSVRQKNPSEVILDTSKAHLASTLGTVSETLSRTFAKMRARGIIAVERDTIRILDRRRLEELSAGEKL